MIKVQENLWIGGAYDEQHAPVNTVLNVAMDLRPTRGNAPGIEYVHIGLIDGPGNPTLEYIMAALALTTLMYRKRKVLVCCHGGWSRSAAIVIMYMNLMHGGGWRGCLDLINERLDVDVCDPHPAHREAFDKVNWSKLSEVITGATK